MKQKWFCCCVLIFILLSGCAAPTVAPAVTLTLKPTAPHAPKLTQTPDATGTRVWEVSFAKTLTAEPSPTFLQNCGVITLGSSGTQIQDKNRRALVQGTVVLCNATFRDENGFYFTSIPRQEAQLDLDTGSSGTGSTPDIWFYAGGGSDIFYYLWSLNGAFNVGLDPKWFYKKSLHEGEPTFDECKDIHNMEDSENSPLYSCVITNAGHVSRIKVEQYNPYNSIDSMKISFITWDILVPTITPTP